MNPKPNSGHERSPAPARPGCWLAPAATILVSAGVMGLCVEAVHAQEDVLLSAYEAYVLEHPADMEKRLEYAKMLLERGSASEAVGQFEIVLRDPDLEEDALRHLARLYGWMEQPREQARAYARLLELAPARLDLRRALADLHFEHGREGEGLEQLERILELHPGDLELRRELANRFFWSDQPAEGISQLERLLEARPEDLELHRELARHYFWNHRPAAGIAQLERILEARPDDLELRRELANHYFWTDRPAAGIAQLERILEARPDDLELRRELAKHYFWTDRPAEGVAQLERILDVGPRDPELRWELARRYGDAAATEKAADQYRILLDQSGDRDALEALAEALMVLRRPADAAVHLEQLVAMDSTDSTVRLRLAQALAWSDQPDRALHHLDVILGRTPDEPEALLLAGSLRRWTAAGWYRATQHLDRLLTHRPGDPDARRLLGQLRSTHGPLVAPSVYRSTDSNGVTTTQVPLHAALWLSGDWRLGLRLERSTLTDRREPGDTRRSIHGLSTEIMRAFPRVGTLRGRIGVHASSGSWTPLTGELEYQGRLSRTASASISTAWRPVLRSAPSVDAKILERSLAAKANAQPSRRLDLWGSGSYTWFSDGNRGLVAAVGGQVNVRAAAPSFALFGSYAYEDTETIHPDSRPYWTPRNLSTVAAGVELAGSPVSWAELRLRLGPIRQERISHTYDVGIRLTPGGYHSFDIGFRHLGADLYSERAVSFGYAYRLDFL